MPSTGRNSTVHAKAWIGGGTAARVFGFSLKIRLGRAIEIPVTITFGGGMLLHNGGFGSTTGPLGIRYCKVGG